MEYTEIDAPLLDSIVKALDEINTYRSYLGIDDDVNADYLIQRLLTCPRHLGLKGEKLQKKERCACCFKDFRPDQLIMTKHGYMCDLCQVKFNYKEEETEDLWVHDRIYKEHAVKFVHNRWYGETRIIDIYVDDKLKWKSIPLVYRIWCRLLMCEYAGFSVEEAERAILRSGRPNDYI